MAVTLKEAKPYENNSTYRIRLTLGNTESFIARVYTPKTQIDGHWLTRIFEFTQGLNPQRDEVLAVTSHQENIEEKTYKAAKQFAEQTAVSNKTDFPDLTSRSKSKLEQTTQTS